MQGSKRSRSTRSEPTAAGDGNAPPKKARAKAAPADAAEQRRRASSRRAELNGELVVELRALRSALREILGRYELRVGGQLAELVQRIEGEDTIGAPPKHVPARKAQAMLEAVRAVKLKPKKGRTKDFARLEALAEKLAELAPES